MSFSEQQTMLINVSMGVYNKRLKNYYPRKPLRLMPNEEMTIILNL